MRIAIFGMIFPETSKNYLQHLIKKIENENSQVIIEEQFLKTFKKNISFKKPPLSYKDYDSLRGNADFLISIGGDGTLLKAATHVKNSNIPIMGINTGRLGFISSISTDQIDAAINDLLRENYKIDNRTLLELKTSNELFGNQNFALNEVAVTKKDTSSMIKVDAYVDDEFLNTYCSISYISDPKIFRHHLKILIKKWYLWLVKKHVNSNYILSPWLLF